MKTAIPQQREKKKARTVTKGKRYRCTICRKRSPKPTKAPYYCPQHQDIHFKADSHELEAVRDERDKKKRQKQRQN